MFPPVIVLPGLFPFLPVLWPALCPGVCSALAPSAGLPWLVREGDLQPSLVVLVEPVVLQSVHRDRRLERILEVHETEVELTTRLSHFFYQPHVYETRKRTENVFLHLYLFIWVTRYFSF